MKTSGDTLILIIQYSMLTKSIFWLVVRAFTWSGRTSANSSLLHTYAQT